MRLASVLLLVAVACGDDRPAAPAPAPPAPAPAPVPLARPAPEHCAAAADHVGKLVAALLLPDGTPAEERATITQLIARRREVLVRFCNETSTRDEVDCMLAAEDFPTLAACERFRRQVPAGLLAGDAVTRDDCELFFFRLRQFHIQAGTPPATIDATRTQVIDKCLADAKPGTLICFLASPTYEQARHCP